MCEFNPTKRTQVRLQKDLANYDQKTAYAIIDETPICHISTVVDATPYLQATAHWRIENKVYIHGAVKNKMVNAIRKGAESCLSFSHFDGYILTRSGFNHAVMYRSVIAFSKGRFVENLDEKNKLLKKFIENIQPERWKTIRQPTEEELKQTGIVEFELKEVSAKILSQELAPYVLPGGEMEADDDANYSPWTGIIPYKLDAGEPVSHKNLPELKQ